VNNISVNPDLYGYISDYYHSNNERREDALKAMSIKLAVSNITNIYGISFSGTFGNQAITKDEEELLINIMADSKTPDKPINEKPACYMKVSDYLYGLFIMLLAKEIRTMKEFFFRNNSETQYLELRRLEDTINEKNLEIARLRIKISAVDETVEKQREEIARLTEESFKGDKEAVKPYAAEISGLNGRINELENELEAERRKIPELNALREFMFEAQSEYIPPETTITLAELIRGRKIIIIGGHINWRNKMKERYPSVSFLDGHNTSFDNSVFDKTDIIIFNTANMSHKVYEKSIGYLREKKLKFHYLGRSKNHDFLEAEIISVLT
jgi:hypothetical protein